MSDFYRRLDERMTAERNARIFRDRPENLHDYQGCANDAKRQRESFLVALQTIADMEECACGKCAPCIARVALEEAGLR